MRARRDPRAERQARLISDGERPRFGLVATPQPRSARPRRNPRTLRRAATVLGGARPRIDWHADRTGAAGSPNHIVIDASPASLPEIRVIDEPAFVVLAVPDHPAGALSDHDREIIGAARQFADAGGGAVVALTAGEIDGIGGAGVDRAISLPAAKMGEYDPEGRAAAVLSAIGMLKPRHVLFPESAGGGADLARRVAALSGERLFGGVESIAGGRVSRRTRGGEMEMIGAPPLLISVTGGAAAAHEGVHHEARKLDAPEFTAARKIERAAPLKVDAASIALSDADFILSGGNGVTDWEGFAELGQTLGATLGGSRVICDEGHLPRDRQVGASGSVVTARCYLAFGIAGAPQHLQGITEVRHVLAINTDLHAEMIKRADLAIIADAQAVIPALIAHARSASASVDTRPGSRTGLPSPMGRGRREAPGEGVRTIGVETSNLTDRAYPLTPSLSPWEREPEANARDTADRRGAAKIAVLLSVGRHPASGRARRAPLDGRALEMALDLPGAEIHAIHAGDPSEPALRDYLGMGLGRLTVLAVPQGSDPVAALSAHLKELAPGMILCGSRAEGGEDSGMTPYLIAEALGSAMVGDAVAIDIGAGTAGLTQALPRGKRRLIEARLPVVAAVNAAAPAPRQSAFARARRGVIETIAADAPPDAYLQGCEFRPWRPRPKPMRVAAGSAADRLKTMTETRSGEGAVMIDPTPEEAARAIYDYLLEKRIIGDRS